MATTHGALVGLLGDELISVARCDGQEYRDTELRSLGQSVSTRAACSWIIDVYAETNRCRLADGVPESLVNYYIATHSAFMAR